MRALVIALAACGDSIPTPDAPDIDAGAAGLVRLQFYTDGALGGYPVYFQDADSTLVLATRTDNNGTASAIMAPGGFVTVVREGGNTANMYTYADVQPGDELVVDIVGMTGTSGVPTTSFLLRIPAIGANTFYQLDADCTTGSADVRLAAVQPTEVMLLGCSAPTDLLVRALIGPGLYLFANDITIPTSLNLTGTYRDIEPVTVSVTDIPPSISEIFIAQGLVGSRRYLMADAHYIPTANGAAVLTSMLPTPADGTIMTNLEIPVGGSSVLHLVDWRPATTTSSISYAEAVPLRPYTEVPVFDPTSYTMRWTESPDGNIANIVILELQFSTAQSGNHIWKLLSSRGEEPVVRFPILPRDRLQVAEDAFTFVVNLASVRVVGGGAVQTARTKILGRWPDPIGQTPWPSVGERGTVVYQDVPPFIPD